MAIVSARVQRDENVLLGLLGVVDGLADKVTERLGKAKL
jgi:hypothetical protein